jgi:hypothetical protein
MLDPEAERPVARSLVITFRSIGSLKILNAGSAVSLTMEKSIFHLFTRTHTPEAEPRPPRGTTRISERAVSGSARRAHVCSFSDQNFISSCVAKRNQYEDGANLIYTRVTRAHRHSHTHEHNNPPPSAQGSGTSAPHRGAHHLIASRLSVESRLILRRSRPYGLSFLRVLSLSAPNGMKALSHAARRKRHAQALLSLPLSSLGCPSRYTQHVRRTRRPRRTGRQVPTSHVISHTVASTPRHTNCARRRTIHSASSHESTSTPQHRHTTAPSYRQEWMVPVPLPVAV